MTAIRTAQEMKQAIAAGVQAALDTTTAIQPQRVPTEQETKIASARVNIASRVKLANDPDAKQGAILTGYQIVEKAVSEGLTEEDAQAHYDKCVEQAEPQTVDEIVAHRQ